MSSQKELMEMLHKVLAEQLLARVSDPEAKASDLNVARQFLKDNNIDGVATEGSPLGNLVALKSVCRRNIWFKVSTSCIN